MRANATGRRRQRGFTLLEVLISMVVLCVGLVGLLATFVVAFASTQSSQQDMIAKQIASQTMESIFTARNTANIEWLEIQNVGAGTNPDGIFVTGLQPINQAGVDGIYGTADDSNAVAQTMTLPGRDGIVGTSDDVIVPLTNFQRSIVIAPATDPITGSVINDLRQITITVRYTTPQAKVPKNYVLVAYISQFR